MLIESREHAARTACSLSVSVVPVGYLAGADPVLGAFYHTNGVVAVAAIGIVGRPAFGVARADAGSAAILGTVLALVAEAGIDAVAAGVAVGNDEVVLAVFTPFGFVHHHAGAAPAVTAIPAGVFIQAGVVVRNGKL